MTVIAMTREMGSLGKDVALGIAKELGLEIVHHELVERHIAERMELGESAVHRFLEGRPSLMERWKVNEKRLSRYTAEEVLELASRGNVLIRGWGAAQLLGDVSHVICVRVCAPMTKRVAEMKKRLGVEDEDTVRGEIELNDNAHSRAIQRQFSRNWENPSNYDIVFNTGRISVSDCIAQLCLLANSKAYQETEQSRQTLKDKLVQARIQSVLDTEVADLPYGSGLNVEVASGAVTLSGILGVSRELGPTLAKIKEVKGVSSVDNKVMVVRQSFWGVAAHRRQFFGRVN